MAQQIACDICEQEVSVQMLTNLVDGNVLAIGAGCLPAFYGNMALTLLEAGEHKGPASRCQACRRVHERMTTPVAPIGAEAPADPPLEEPSTGVNEAAEAQ